jgi:hypothetical protein
MTSSLPRIDIAPLDDAMARTAPSARGLPSAKRSGRAAGSMLAIASPLRSPSYR